MVFTSAPAAMEKQAAAVLASIVGRMSDWRGADFPVFYNGTPARNRAVVFAANERRPDFLHDLPKADGPMVTIADAPASSPARCSSFRAATTRTSSSLCVRSAPTVP